MFLNIIFSLAIFSFSSCSIAGEEVCGIWNATGDFGEMQVEITPWEGKFLGYLLEYNDGDKTVTGSKTEDFIFITDLEFKDNKYQNGKIYLDPSSENFCELTVELLDKNQLKAIYVCEGQSFEEVWYREGVSMPEKTVKVPAKTATTNNTVNPTRETTTSTNASDKIPSEQTSTVKNEPTVPTQTKVVLTPMTTTSTAPSIDGETKKRSAFYIIGMQEVVKYDDFKAIEKAMEALWNNSYNKDFSSQLTNITDQENMYVSYSNYDNPKGKMTITLGYAVNDLANIPTGLSGVQLPANEYLVYPMAGDKSDYEDEGWNQLGELMMYRKKDSADFEVYTFDENYNITKAEMWIATK